MLIKKVFAVCLNLQVYCMYKYVYTDSIYVIQHDLKFNALFIYKSSVPPLTEIVIRIYILALSNIVFEDQLNPL